ncbi:Protein MTSS 1 [Geodia barretti]|uniref:Protein MTSS 1 n=1 Tax=Geodia barretti TaxID=519541 RepID=A0AA35WC26_GEOBA|nr:Protein MTSS 1 [Geodia barretti]
MTDSHDGFRDLSGIGDMFKSCVAHMKGGFPAWEEFVTRGIKFQKHFEQTISSFNGFIDSLYKISELAHNTKGGTYEIGTGLINLAMWHRGQEMKLKEMNTALMTKLLGPLQVKVEEWKKTTGALEREHDKDKGSEKTTTLHQQLEHYHHETDRHLKETEDREKRNLNRVLLEERSWFCGFVNAFTRVLDVGTGMLVDLERLQAILKDLSTEVSHPAILPETTREILETWTIPASPATLHKKMSTAPSMISVSSGSSGDSGGPVISGPIMTGSSTHSGSPVGTIPIQQPQPPTPPNPAPPPPPGAPPLPGLSGRDSVGFPPPPPPLMNVPHPPPAPPTSVPSSMMAHLPSPRPPPPSTAPPPSSHPFPSHAIPQQHAISRAQTLPRNFANYRGASLDTGLGMSTAPKKPVPVPNMQMNHYMPPPQGGGVPYNANGDYIQNRSLPPVPPGEDPYLPMNSVPVSRGSLVSATLPRSTDSFPSSQLFTHIEESVEPPSSLQEQLVSRLRGRSQSIQARTALSAQPDNVYSMPSEPVRASNSVSGKMMMMTGPPPVSSKPHRPPAVALKPSRASNGHGGSPVHSFMQSPAFSQSLDGWPAPPPFHQPPSSSADLELDPEEDNMFARALRERKLRSVQTNDRSDPLVGR